MKETVLSHTHPIGYVYSLGQEPLVEYALELVYLVTGVPFEKGLRQDEGVVNDDLWVRPRYASGELGAWMHYPLTSNWKGLPGMQVQERSLESGIVDRAAGHPDWLLSMVWMALRVEEYRAPLDEHGRVISEGLHAVKNRQEQVPWIHVWAKSLLLEWGGVPQHRFQSKVEISVDIDHLLAYAGRNWFHVLLAAGRDFLVFRWRKVFDRLLAKAGRVDAYDTLNEQIELWSEAPWKYFALVQLQRNNRDTGVDVSVERARKLWRSIDEATGGQLGWHPSTAASQGMQKGLLFQEFQQINNVLKRQVDATRFHFLAFTPQAMYPVLDEMGIKHDYSMGFVDTMGWRAGIGIPYPWFDLSSNRRLNLWVHPFYAMDGHLLYYNRSGSAFEDWLHAAELCAANEVPFSWVTHWRMFSEQAPEWRGWKEFVKKLQQWHKKN
jgi:hypothetical protein